MRKKRRRPVYLLRRLLVIGLAAAACAVLYSRAERFYMLYAYPIRYEETVTREAARNNLPVSLVYAVIRTESGFRPDARSRVGARGLMQIMEETYEWVAFRLREKGGDFSSMYDIEENIRYGTALLRLLLDEFGTDENALCAYHAGWGSVKSWLANTALSPDGENVQNIPFGDTARYVKKVLDTQEIYQRLYQIM
ncbi:MAG: lytic transglycosylase domain-containing protein [Oscillospiraceae bacterium]|nr:lytic transglycosylase domain-containing protein [Oscillospiraceae bacterium]